MRRLFKLSVVALILSSACMKEQECVVSDGTATPVFSSSSEECTGAESRTSMTSTRKVVWSEGDRLSIFMGASEANMYQVDAASVGSVTGQFTYAGEDDGFVSGTDMDCNVAYYPYAPQLSLREADGCFEIGGISLPAEQTYAAGSFGPGVFPVVAVTDAIDDYSLDFRNVCGVVRISMTGLNTVTSVRIQGKNNELLAGNAVLKVSGGMTPSVVMSEDGASSSVTLQCPDGVRLDPSQATDFFIVVPPVSFSKGFTVDVTYAGGAVHTFSTDKSNTVMRSAVLAMPAVELPYLEDDKAYLLNLAFNADGTVTDRSPMEHKVETFASARTFNYYNEALGSYACHFGNEPGDIITTGYHKIDYKDNTAMKEALADGFSAEVVFKCNELPQSSVYCSLMSSVQGSGFGICLLNSTHEIRFEIQTTEESEKLKLHTGIVPEPGRYYHVAAVWDGTEAKVYVNGEFAVSGSAKGELVFPTASCQWIGIGADSDGDKAATPFNGDIAMARIHDVALTDGEVAAMYTPVTDADVISENIYSRSSCTIAPGCSYYIYQDEAVSGDETVVLTAAGHEPRVCSWTATEAGDMKVTVPSDLDVTECALHLRRGDSFKTLGLMQVGAEPYAKVPGVFAHRCKGSGDYQENTVTGLIATQGRYADGITGGEFDVWVTSDGEVVVYHDPSITYKTWIFGSEKTCEIQSSDYSTVKSAFGNAGKTLNTLDEFLEQGLKAPEVILNFEIKEHSTDERNLACAEAVAERLTKWGIVSQCRVMSYSEVALDRLHELIPELKVDFLDKSPDVAYTVSKGYDGIEANMDNLTPAIVTQAHEADLEIIGFTPATEAEVMHLMNLDVDYITVNDVDLALEVVTRPYVSK